ncbi:MAG TPA: YlxR family protein [Actinomycetota bacterium]|nr:YlxR family protein [Actinomycetota bacterium]
MRKRSASVAGGEAVPQRVGAKGTPRRTCVVCRSTAAKRTLHRIVRSPAGTVAYDPTGKAAGRGAYLCGQPACLERAVRRRSIQRALKVTDAAAADAAVEALRNRMWSGSTDQPAPRSSDSEEVRSG